MNAREWLDAIIITIVIVSLGASVRSMYYLGALCFIFAVVVLSLVTAYVLVPNEEER